MSATSWMLTYVIHRRKGQAPAYWEQHTLAVDPDEYLLDGIERIWAFADRSLLFRHACHHSTCGACGMVVNGVEKLSCITRIRDITRDGGIITLEPLRNFPVVSDLVVDMSQLYTNLEAVGFTTVTPIDGAVAAGEGTALQLVDCIECGLCVSACPVMATALSYLGPATLAAAQHDSLGNTPSAAPQLDSQDGLWRCHNSFECSAVCPSGVDPAARIMALRRQVLRQQLKQLRKPQR